MPYLVMICDMNAMSVEIDFSSALDNDQLPKTFQLTLDENSSPQDMTDEVIISPRRATITVVECKSLCKCN